MRVAIVHYWLLGMRGGERVLEEIAGLYPQADVFTHVADPARLSPALASRRIRETFVGRLPFARRLYKAYLGFMPRALEELDLRGYDLVISSESGPAKGVTVPPAARHFCYCHSPMRYVWDQFPDYAAEMPAPMRALFARQAHRMRAWDCATAGRIDRIAANSAFVAERVRRYWARSAEVIHPPVALDRFAAAKRERDAPYLFVSALTGYKRADLAIDAFRGSDRRLDIIGDGPDRARLERTAPANVRFLGPVADDQVAAAYGRSRALIFPGEEDFGLTPVEAMASGLPVIAFGRGGATETVRDGETGVFFDEQSAGSLREAVERFERLDFDPARLRERAERFSQSAFRERFGGAVDALMAAPPAEARI